VTNPPFSLAEQFVRHALSIAACKVAMLLPAIWLLGDKRSRWLETTPLARVLFITPRPSMPPGAAIMAGQKPGNGTADYAWLIWSRGYMGTIRRECLDHMIVFEEAHLRRKPWEVCRLLK
jgi:hypothetical protein